MPSVDSLSDGSLTITLDTFWEWLASHPNCILRAGTENAVMYDDDDYHWQLSKDPGGALLAQVVRGKRLVGELVLTPEEIGFVRGIPGEQENEFVFELMAHDAPGRVSLAFFVMTHGFDSDSELAQGPVH